VRVGSNPEAQGAALFQDAAGHDILQFRQPGSFTVQQRTTASLLLVGPGGAGGAAVPGYPGGGGGAGAVIFYPAITLEAGAYTVQVGLGNTTVLYNDRLMFLATAGGVGGSSGLAGGAGGSGGGSGGTCYASPSVAAAGRTNVLLGQPTQGPGPNLFENAGGVCVSRLPNYGTMDNFGGGGGGAGGNGSSAFPPIGGDGLYQVAVNGAAYVFSDLFAGAYTSVAELHDGNFYIAGGGSGSAYVLNVGFLTNANTRGGYGGGGRAGICDSAEGIYSPGLAGAPNSGGGGGGGTAVNHAPGSGAAGLVLVRYMHKVSCSPGSYADASFTACVNCTAGTHSTITGLLDASGCTNCSLGTYAPLPGASNCSLCAADHYCDWISSKPCPAGLFSMPGASGVEQCACPVNASFDGGCACDAGFGTVMDSQALGGWRCLLCSPGGYAPRFSMDCDVCPANHFCALSSSATPCPNGTYAWPGSTSVDQCACPVNALSNGVECACGDGFQPEEAASALGGWRCVALPSTQAIANTNSTLASTAWPIANTNSTLASTTTSAGLSKSTSMGRATTNTTTTSVHSTAIRVNATTNTTTTSVNSTAIRVNATTNTTTSVHSTATTLMVNATTPTPDVAAYITTATVGVSESHYTVCTNLTFYVQGFCGAMQQANPADSFTCQAKELDGVACPCACNASRRLLAGYTEVVIDSLHGLEAVQPPNHTLPWMVSIVVRATCPVSGCASTGVSLLLVAVVLVLVVVLVVLGVILCVWDQGDRRGNALYVAIDPNLKKEP
jgi:hypothetical protein